GSPALPSAAWAHHEQALWRPLPADPRECQFRMKWVAYTEDWRYGTDITNPASRGGVLRDRHGVTWDVGVGTSVRLPSSSRGLGPLRPWDHFQFAIPAGVFAHFDRVGADLVNADYQFGPALDILWTREHFDGERGITGFDAPIQTTRVMLFHRSTHIGDEYLADGHFGQNQDGFPSPDNIFAFPPVKRVNLSFESW